MAEYIEREALLAEYDRVHVGPAGGARKLIEEAPTAYVAPVVHGRWLHVHVAVVDTTGDCSACNTEAVWRTRRKPYSLCPNCGARMKGGE